jgi:CheY-like chemotaxis protein
MDEATLARVFEPFFTTKERGRGTGLGLATVYGIVVQSQGEITARSVPGEGSAFEIRFPASTDPLPADTGPRSGAGPAEARTILLVEDEQGVRSLFGDVLRRAGHHVLEAGDPEAALGLAAEAPSLDLLLTDVVMPGMSGRQLAERLQAARPGLKVVYMSGYTDHILESEQGGWDFLQKPCSLEALLGKVREVLAR